MIRVMPSFDAYFTFHSLPILYIDVIALIWFIAAWFGYHAFAQSQYARRPNLLRIVDEMRLSWMKQMLARDNRIVDSTIISNLQRSITFFASTSIFVLLGLITIIGYGDKAIAIIDAIPFAMAPSEFMWDIKIFLLAFIFVYSFFKYTWSLRQYNYASIFVGAAPFPDACPSLHAGIATQGAALISNAGKHFNLGLRAYYFGLAAIAWFFHSLLFIAVSAVVVYVIYRREFISHTVHNLSGMEAECEGKDAK